MAFFARAVVFALLHGIVPLVVADAPGPTMPNTIKTCNKWFAAKDGDTCTTATKAGGINLVKFNQWNPDVPKDCSQNFIPGYFYCIGVGDTTQTGSVGSTTRLSVTSTSKVATSQNSASTTATTTVNETYSIRNPISTWNITATTPVTFSSVPPKETQAGQPSYCIDWHLVGRGEDCQTIVNRYSNTLSMNAFLDYNPAVRDDCSGLLIDTFVCIRIQPQSSLTLTWVLDPNGPSIPADTPWTPTTLPVVDTSFTPEPTQGPLPDQCQGFYQAKADDRCDNVLAENPMVSREDFFRLNPFLEGNCDGLWAGYYYCIWDSQLASNSPDPLTVTDWPSPQPEGGASNCVAWYQTSGGDTCDLIVTIFGRFSVEDFITWNPSVGSSCDRIKDDLFYCVAVPGTPATRTAPVPTWPTQVPTQSGIASDCVSFWTVSALDSCQSIVRARGISMDNFLRWNPAIGTKCDHLLPGYDVCVLAGSGGSTSATDITSVQATATSKSDGSPTTFTPTSTSGTGGISTPTPNQGGMIAGCRRFYLTQPDDGCWAISSAAKIDLNDFYKWNPSTGNDCSNLWVGQYVCIGLEGPTTTISSGSPVPT